jgi:hypothetical protein
MAVRMGAAVARDLAFAEGKIGVRYAAEKCGPSYVPRLISELAVEAKEIFLVRDFRDVLASILAFNAKRGYPAFGRESVTSDLAFIDKFATDVRMLATAWSERADAGLLVKYEDLVTDQHAAMACVLDYLELETASGEVQAIVDRAEGLLDAGRSGHRTTDSVAESTGRWERDLPLELRAACAEALAGPLREFGYE